MAWDVRLGGGGGGRYMAGPELDPAQHPMLRGMAGRPLIDPLNIGSAITMAASGASPYQVGPVTTGIGQPANPMTQAQGGGQGGGFLGGLSGIEKAYLLSQAIGGLANVYSGYREGKRRDEERDRSLRERAQSAEAIAPFLRQYLGGTGA